MSLDVRLLIPAEKAVFEWNITHNLNEMARMAGLYEPLWRPDEIDPPIKTAIELVPFLDEGLHQLLTYRDRLRELNPKNGWGTYDNLVAFVVAYRVACRKWPQARVEVSR